MVLLRPSVLSPDPAYVLFPPSLDFLINHFVAPDFVILKSMRIRLAPMLLSSIRATFCKGYLFETS